MNSLLTSFKLVAKIVGIQEVWRERGYLIEYLVRTSCC